MSSLKKKTQVKKKSKKKIINIENINPFIKKIQKLFKNYYDDEKYWIKDIKIGDEIYIDHNKLFIGKLHSLTKSNNYTFEFNYKDLKNDIKRKYFDLYLNLKFYNKKKREEEFKLFKISKKKDKVYLVLSIDEINRYFIIYIINNESFNKEINDIQNRRINNDRKNGILIGGSDPRKDGMAIGY